MYPQQLNGELSDNESVIIQLKFAERSRIAETLLYNPLTFTAEKGFRRYINLSMDIIVLCKRRERRRSRTYYL
jgi:hypothetical protein